MDDELPQERVLTLAGELNDAAAKDLTKPMNLIVARDLVNELHSLIAQMINVMHLDAVNDKPYSPNGIELGLQHGAGS